MPTASQSLFAGLSPQQPDVLLSLIKAFNDDPHPHKIDLGVGVYRTPSGATPVFSAVKAAERELIATQATKAYLGPEGDLRFLDLLRPVIFGPGPAGADMIAVQTPGGTGALRLAGDLAQAGRPRARIWLGTPSWPIHSQIFARAGLEVATYRHFDPKTGAVDFDALMDALQRAEAGDLFLLHGCCHNPTGADLTFDQWGAVTDQVLRSGVTPLVDLAYQGLGEGLDADAKGLRRLFEAVDDAILAYSCDKNFGLYRERTGALFVRSRRHAPTVRSNLLSLARVAWSMPPDHGAAAVRLILDSPILWAVWRDELEGMRLRLDQLRRDLAEAHPMLAPLRGQHGLFAQLPLDPGQVEALRRDHAIYMAGSGRINLAGLNATSLPIFAQALDACLAGAPA